MLLSVRGPIAVDVDAAADTGSVGWVLPHEHLFHRIYDNMLLPSERQVIADPAEALAPDQLQALRVEPWLGGGCNLIIEKEDEAFREAEALAEAAGGGGVVVDVTTTKEGKDSSKLARLAERLPLHLIMTTSLDEDAIQSLPTSLTLENKCVLLAKRLETELLFGLPDSSPVVHVGAIYQQVHCSSSINEPDTILQRTLAMIQQSINVPIYLSFSYDRSSSIDDDSFRERITAWIAQVIGNGAASQRIALCHSDRWSDSTAGLMFLADLAMRGVNLSFNMIGHYTVTDTTIVNPCCSPVQQLHAEPPHDREIARCIATLIRESNALSQILLSTGVTQRIQMQRYGGGGMAYLFRFFNARLVRDHGITAAEWEQMTRRNPLRLLSWYSPPTLAPPPKELIACSICGTRFEPIEGEYFTKFSFVYCGTKCLRKHRIAKFAPLTTT